MSVSDCNGHMGSVMVMLNMCDSYKVDFGDKVCRSCLSNAEDMKSLHDPYSEEMCVSDVFTCITSLQCSADNDVLPTQICHECFGKLHSSYQFVLKSRESNKKLQRYLNKIHKTEEKFVAGNIRNISGITITDGRSVKSENVTHFSATTLPKTGHNLNVVIEEIQIEDKTEMNNFSNDLTLSNRDLSTENEIKSEGYQSNDNMYEHSYEPIKTLSTVEMQNDFDQELDLIKHEIDIDIKTEISNDMNYKSSIAINNEPANEQAIGIASEIHLQSNQIANMVTSDGNNEMENEMNNFSNDLTLSNRDLSTENEIKTEGYQSNDNMYEHSCEPIKTLSIAEMQNDFDQELDLIKHEIDIDIKTEILNDINYKSSIAINNEPANEQDIGIASEIHLQSNQIANMVTSDGNNDMENELNDSLISFDANKSTLFNRSNAETSTVIKLPFKQSLANQPKHLLNSMNPCVVLERLNVNLISTYCRTQNQYKKTNTVILTNKIPTANIEMTENDHEHVQRLPKTRPHLKNQRTKNVYNKSAERQYSCKFCNKLFGEKVKLAHHRRMHMIKYTCAVCNQPFNLKSHLVRHVRIHTGEKPYSCTACNKSFNQKTTLVRHIRTHTGEKKYSCTACNKSFNQKIELVRHGRIHTGEKPYSCTICNKSFNLKTNLIQHERIHSGAKPYLCTTCNKSFNRKAILVRHMRSHTGKKPYSCTSCNKSFTRKTNLVQHERLHTGEMYNKKL